MAWIRIQGLPDPDWDFWLDPDSIEYGYETLLKWLPYLFPPAFRDILIKLHPEKHLYVRQLFERKNYFKI